MKVSYRKIKEFLPTSISATDAAAVLTATGLEIEGVETVEDIPGGLKGLVVGKITDCNQHPNADRLKVCRVDIGSEELDIVCGAPNAATGLNVIVAKHGTWIHPTSGEPFKIKRGKIRGEVSNGMLCGPDEVGLGEDTGGIMELDPSLKPGSLVSDAFNIGSDEVLEIGLTPNRNDAMGHYGVARDLRAGLIHGTVCEIQEEKLQYVCVPESADIDFSKGFDKLKASVVNAELASKYILLGIDGVKIGPSPQEAQRFLKSIGVAPINNVVDATNYVLHELGQPLHAFDYDKIGGEEIIVRQANKGEKITTLDDVERKLDTEDLVIADAKDAMCIAGVFGSGEHGVSENTTRVLIESAFFNPISVRKSAKRYGLSTDASFRFERQVDPNLVEEAAKRVAQLIINWAGGKVFGATHVTNNEKIEGATIELDLDMMDRVIGAKLERDRVSSILESLDIEISSKDESTMILHVPAYRSDVTRPADIIEEILRIHGFDQIEIPSHVSIALEIPQKPNREDEIFGWASTLVAKGYNEIMSNSLTKASYAESVNDRDLNPKETVEILNPLSSDLRVMRQSLVFQGIEAIARNKNHKVSDLRLFELGRTYMKTADGYSETEHLSLFVRGNKSKENWNEKSTESDLFTIKEGVWALFSQIGIATKVTERPDEGGLLLEGSEILMDEKSIGRFGLVHPDVVEMCGMDGAVYWADLLVKPLLKARKKHKIVANDLPKFPSVRRDLSLIIDKSVSFEQIKTAAFETERKLLKEVNLFDVYEGDNLDKGKVSYAISLVIQDPNSTLTDKKIDKCVSRILDSITQKTGGNLR
ncbi:MAG: phenylalanine--tRNA ligase subunit beta [Crocinitomicaceae bacterium]|nr:phenylalanine--tRNA ligase subunit beta [Crocinitomicaceae bacterium]|tara:strand:- start:3927 stop:6380 length:2454 start_codon:yes stop_codon:yes gene_type:complete